MLLAGGLLACQTAAKEPKPVNPYQPINGTAQITELDTQLGCGKMKTPEGYRNFWWNTNLQIPYVQTGRNIRPLSEFPTGEPMVRQVDFPAGVGDTINYYGLLCNRDIFLIRFVVTAKASGKK